MDCDLGALQLNYSRNPIESKCEMVKILVQHVGSDLWIGLEVMKVRLKVLAVLSKVFMKVLAV